MLLAMSICFDRPQSEVRKADSMKTKVLIVDDSALIRGVMKEIINSQPDMEVVGAAPDPLVARDLIKQTNPDVLTLDVEMPKMDGLDFLERLMRLRPMPVVMVSSLTERGSDITMRALELGAVDFVTKPKMSIESGMLEYADLIAEKIRIAARANMVSRDRLPTGWTSCAGFPSRKPKAASACCRAMPISHRDTPTCRWCAAAPTT